MRTRNPVAEGWARAVMRKSLRIQQGRIHGNQVADGWAGAVVQKPPGIQKHYIADRSTNRPTRQGVESRVRD